jgi:type VI protein secretion system component Hcp
MSDEIKKPEVTTDAHLPKKELDKVVGGETITLNYGAIKWVYTEQKPDGTVEPTPAPPAK